MEQRLARNTPSLRMHGRTEIQIFCRWRTRGNMWLRKRFNQLLRSRNQQLISGEMRFGVAEYRAPHSLYAASRRLCSLALFQILAEQDRLCNLPHRLPPLPALSLHRSVSFILIDSQIALQDSLGPINRFPGLQPPAS